MPKRRTLSEASLSVTLSCSAQSVGSLALTTSTASSSAAFAVTAANPANKLAAAMMSRIAGRERSAHRRINVSGIRRRRQRADPGGNLLPGAPLREREDLLLADRGIEPRVAQRGAAFQAHERHLALDRGELEGKRGNRTRESGERLRFISLDVDLDEGRRSMARDQRVERGHRHRDAIDPLLALPTRRTAGSADESVGRGAYRRVVEIEFQHQLALVAADRDRLDHHRSIAAVQQLQGFHEQRLRLDGDDARAEPPECGDAVADVRADVEHQIAGLDESCIEAIHRGVALPAAVIDAQRAQDAARIPASIVVPGRAGTWAGSSAGSASARSAGGGSVSSGSRTSFWRTSAL